MDLPPPSRPGLIMACRFYKVIEPKQLPAIAKDVDNPPMLPLVVFPSIEMAYEAHMYCTRRLLRRANSTVARVGRPPPPPPTTNALWLARLAMAMERFEKKIGERVLQIKDHTGRVIQEPANSLEIWFFHILIDFDAKSCFNCLSCF